MAATDMAAEALLADPVMTQLQLNQMAGRIADENAPRILAEQGITVRGSQVTAIIGDEIRYIDRLAETPGGQIVNVEVKADGAVRKLNQRQFDQRMATEGAVLGNNAPPELQGVKMVIRTFVLRVNTKLP